MQQKLYLLLLIPWMFSCDPKDGKDLTKGKFTYNDTITVAKAIEHQQRYIVFRNPDKELKDTLANNGWISLKDLELYIALAKQYAKKNKKEISGFRIYNAKYPENIMKGNLTYFISPTGKDNVKAGYFQGSDGSDPADDPDLTYAPLNYINAGKPPKKEYPSDGE